MRTLIVLAIATAATAGALVATATASQPAASTIEQCAALLPKGKTYRFTIAGSVDTTGALPVLSGEMSVNDGTEADRSAETESFGQCMARLIR